MTNSLYECPFCGSDWDFSSDDEEFTAFVWCKMCDYEIEALPNELNNDFYERVSRPNQRIMELEKRVQELEKAEKQWKKFTEWKDAGTPPPVTRTDDSMLAFSEEVELLTIVRGYCRIWEDKITYMDNDVGYFLNTLGWRVPKEK